MSDKFLYIRNRRFWHIRVDGSSDEAHCGRTILVKEGRDIDSPPKQVCRNCLHAYGKLEAGE